MKQKCPAELNSRVVRIHIGDYQLLTELRHKLGKTMAEVLHLVITQQARQESMPVTPRTQIPMALGTTAYRAIPTTAYRSGPTTALATNGSKTPAFRIKPRSVRYD